MRAPSPKTPTASATKHNARTILLFARLPMPLSRTITQTGNATNYSTYLFGDQVFQSSWSNRKIPALIFAENKLPGFSVQNHGGPIGSGMPVELLFWGDWWNSPEGATRRNLIESRTKSGSALRLSSIPRFLPTFRHMRE
jgi:hypothetical protein